MTGPAKVARKILHHSKIETPIKPVCGFMTERWRDPFGNKHDVTGPGPEIESDK